jgi:hypothetical protein
MYTVSELTSHAARAPFPMTRVAPANQGVIVRIIAKVIESMLSKDATQKWNGQTSAFEPNNVWHWNP